MRIVFICMLVLLSVVSCEDKTEIRYVSSWPDGAPKIEQTIRISDDECIAQTKYYQDGTVEMTGGMQAGKRHGEWRSFYFDGKPWTINNYDHGVLHGEYYMYNKNGSLKLSGNYEKGEESGHWKYYDKEGNFVREADF